MGKRQFFSYLIVLVATSVLSLKLFAKPVQAAALPAGRQDYRVQKLANFFASQNSPLVYYAPDFVYYADQNGLDYRLLPAISGMESTFAKNYIQGTFNAYGWGQGSIPFSSWQDGIAKVTAGLRANYVNRGATTIEQIGKIYCPPTYEHWSSGVRLFMNQIENIGFSPNLTVSFVPTHLQLPLSI